MVPLVFLKVDRLTVDESVLDLEIQAVQCDRPLMFGALVKKRRGCFLQRDGCHRHCPLGDWEGQHV
jgi:hypothetical protein